MKSGATRLAGCADDGLFDTYQGVFIEPGFDGTDADGTEKFMTDSSRTTKTWTTSRPNLWTLLSCLPPRPPVPTVSLRGSKCRTPSRAKTVSTSLTTGVCRATGHLT